MDSKQPHSSGDPKPNITDPPTSLPTPVNIDIKESKDKEKRIHEASHIKPASSPRQNEFLDEDNPEERANVFSLLSYGWLTPLFWKGYRGPLQKSDIWRASAKFDADDLSREMTELWHQEMATKKALNQAPQLKSVVFRFIFKRITLAGVAKFIGDSATVLSPLVLKYLIEYIQRYSPSQSLGEGFIYVSIMFALSIVSTIMTNYFFQSSIVAGIQARTAISAMVYRKSLLLSPKARQNFNAGKVINIVSTDCQRIELFISFFHVLWAAPLQILFIIALMISQIGPAAIAGVGLIFLLTPVQGILFKKLAMIRKSVAPIADKRVKALQEVLSGIKVIKFFTWEDPFITKIEDLRSKEMEQVFKRSLLNAIVMAIVFGIPVLCASIAFVIYGLTNPLNPSAIFPTLTWFGVLRFPLMFLPHVLVGLADFKVALTRIQELLVSAELECQIDRQHDEEHAVKLQGCNFEWEIVPKADEESEPAANTRGRPSRSQSKRGKKEATVPDPSPPAEGAPAATTGFELKNININFPKGKLVAVVGAVGSGKSSLLNAIIGEMKKMTGQVVVDGKIGYAAQQAWIQNATVERNVTFGLDYNEEKYARSIKLCSLERDLELFPDGDQTEIGERGINLSGGQKQRVNLARCMYFDADIILLDDPLSAVDAHVGKDLFEKCILNGLSNKTRILVTHQLHFLPKVDYVVVMSEGSVCEQGTYNELMNKDGEFARLMKSYGGVSEQSQESPLEAKKEEEATIDTFTIQKSLLKYRGKKGKELMTVEERAQGSVKLSVWLDYVSAAGGLGMLLLIFLNLLITNAFAVGNNFWLVIWTENRISTFGSSGPYIGVYFGFGVAQMLGTFLNGIIFAFVSTKAAKTLHKHALKRVLRAPMSFFDTTPLGRIVNRFSKDQDNIDSTLSDSVRMFLNTLVSAMATFVVIIFATPFFAAPLLPLLLIYFFIQLIYRAAVRELKRLDSISRSPLFAHFGETMTGLPTIRAYNEQSRFIRICDKHLTDTNSPYFLLKSSERWLSVRLEVIGALIVFFASCFGVLARGTITPAILGLSLSYALQVTGVLNWCVRQFAETEVAMNAVERLSHYGKEINVEADAIIDDSRPPPSWPSTGAISFESLDMKYAPTLPLIIKQLSVKILNKEKVGIVGRTGSGKSSLMNAMFRMIEPAGGTILIDGVDVCKIGLKDLRSKLGIIPQDPVLFSGTFRSNLDPFGEYQDADLWDALGRANLKEKVVAAEGGLDAPIQEGGENLSVGQRQLLCLARAMLRRPKILVMDEATANVDYETDGIIQRSLREDFKHSTILTIAHRLNTIIDYDKVMVLDSGKIAEYGSPKSLLEIPQGKFLAMVDETGPVNADLLKKTTQLKKSYFDLPNEFPTIN